MITGTKGKMFKVTIDDGDGHTKTVFMTADDLFVQRGIDAIDIEMLRVVEVTHSYMTGNLFIERIT